MPVLCPSHQVELNGQEAVVEGYDAASARSNCLLLSVLSPPLFGVFNLTFTKLLHRPGRVKEQLAVPPSYPRAVPRHYATSGTRSATWKCAWQSDCGAQYSQPKSTAQVGGRVWEAGTYETVAGNRSHHGRIAGDCELWKMSKHPSTLTKDHKGMISTAHRRGRRAKQAHATSRETRATRTRLAAQRCSWVHGSCTRAARWKLHQGQPFVVVGSCCVSGTCSAWRQVRTARPSVRSCRGMAE